MRLDRPSLGRNLHPTMRLSIIDLYRTILIARSFGVTLEHLGRALGYHRENIRHHEANAWRLIGRVRRRHWRRTVARVTIIPMKPVPLIGRYEIVSVQCFHCKPATAMVRTGPLTFHCPRCENVATIWIAPFPLKI